MHIKTLSFSRLLYLISSSLRYKLLSLVLFPILLVTPAILLFAVYMVQYFSYEQLLLKVNTDLSVAHAAFQRIQQDHLGLLKELAGSYAFRDNLLRRDFIKLKNQLLAQKLGGSFDYLHLSTISGQDYFSDLELPNVISKTSDLFHDAVYHGLPHTGIELFSQEDLKQTAPNLAKQVQLPLLDTLRASPTQRTTEDRGLMLRMVYPVRNLHNNVIAVLDGGILLNNNFDFVDKIRDLVYGAGSLPADSLGTVTVFLEDVRISTNVPLDRGERALGTRVSQQVRDQVLQQGEKWIDRAFVVNDWYISAYEPLVDVQGQRVGMLYTGFLETPFRNDFYEFISLLLFFLLCGAGFAAFLAIRGAQSIFKPIEAISRVVRATQAGQDQRIGALSSHDEIGELAHQFDHMLDLLNQRNQQIQKAAEGLEHEVTARTQALREQNHRLEKTIELLKQTQQQLILAEKLAALGELTAGVAHEINNPTAVIMGNMDVLMHVLGQQAAPVQTEIDLIIEQVYRIQAIVSQLLQYARPSSDISHVSETDIETVLGDTLLLVKHELANKATQIETQFQAQHHCVLINRQALQQVLINLIINSIQSTPIQGKITLMTEDWLSDQQTVLGVVITVADNGEGIAEDQLGRIFDPFFTSRKEGTGLGLSVSYSIIQRYGGDIRVSSKQGEWTQFQVFLRQKPVFSKENSELVAVEIE